ncbi:MAG: DHHA1 domain-containing protein [Patescibacteria group bacterium]|nr:DHHA1 domain-containing protein [Patescibacteria group bacterium]
MKIKDLRGLIKILKSKINSANNILIVSHTKPDPDCLFSQLALYYLLKNKYPKKKFLLFNRDYIYEKDILKDINRDLRFIKNSVHLSPNEVDLIIAIEPTDLERLGLEEKFIDYRKIIVIDHHKSFSLKKSLYYLEEKTECCSIIIFKIAKALKFKPNLKFKISILSGIIGDTVALRYIRNKETFLILSKIYDKKINIFKIIKHIYGFNWNDFKKINFYLNKIKLNKKKKCLLIYLNNNKKLKKSGSFIEFLRLIKEVETIIFLTQKDNQIYGSLRSEKVDVSEIAKKFNGGGHKNSAGFTTDLPAKKVIRLILNNIKT